MNVEQKFASIEQIRDRLQTRPSTVAGSREADTAKSFGQILADTAGQVRFSKHAAQRLETRNIVTPRRFQIKIFHIRIFHIKRYCFGS